MGRRNWTHILDRARSIIRTYDGAVTLRQLFYRLVSESTLPNEQNAYKALSSKTAEARRAGDFPALVDRTRKVARPYFDTSPEAALCFTARAYRRDRTAGQPCNIYLGIEKDALGGLLEGWFRDRGLPVVVCRGYASQTLKDDVSAELAPDPRPSVFLYAGDFDPSGADILRDFTAHVPFDRVVRVALTSEQIEEHDLPPQPGKRTDSRAAAFERRHGRLVQVELDALPPTTLHELYERALAEVWDAAAYDAVIGREREERRRLEQLAKTWAA